jgi:transposase InsO family protein
LDEEGITVSTSERYDPRTNGKAERFNRTANSKARCLLLEAQLPNEFWGYAVKHAVFLYNHTPRQQRATKDCPWRTPQGLYEGKDDSEILKRIKDIPTFGELGCALIPKN